MNNISKKAGIIAVALVIVVTVIVSNIGHKIRANSINVNSKVNFPTISDKEHFEAEEKMYADIKLRKQQSMINNVKDTEKIRKVESTAEQRIRDYLGDKINNVGLSYYDINSKKSFNINGDKYFVAASTVKIQINMVLYDMVQQGIVNIDEKIKYKPEVDYEEGTGILQDMPDLNEVEIKKLSDYSIVHSDNIATKMITRRLDYDSMKDTFSKMLGHTVPKENLVTPNEESKYLQLLYENPNENPYYENVINAMKNTVFHGRLDRYLPEDIVAHKIGSFDPYINDVGIIYAPNPYILTVYTNGMQNAEEVIGRISKIIYEEQQKL